jgi:3-dehydroquinate synthase
MSDTIQFSKDPTNDLKRFLESKKYSKVTVLLDENTARHCYPLLRDGLPQHSLLTVSSGEESKNLATAEVIWKGMTDHLLDRHSVLIIIGGGVLGDMGGFCAATYKRGIDFVLVPTTLLSQVDASIGGKLGIDFHNFKNHIGVFQVPALTLLFSGFLQTLPETELRSGFAEIVKHTLISDKPMWNEIRSKKLHAHDWDRLIRHSVEFKSRVTNEDPRERSLRKILNAGHTIGHAIETYLLTEKRKVMHGEAVAAGLVAESYLAREKGLLSPGDFQDITDGVLKVFGKVQFSPEDEGPISRLTVQDKKNKGNRILCVLLEGIGKARFDCEISVEEVKQALMFYRTLQM